MALALGFVFLTDSLTLLFLALNRADTVLWHVLGNLTSFVAASLYIRATQLFPHHLTADDLAKSRTVWGKVRLLRGIFAFLLRAPVVWLLIAILTALNAAVRNKELNEAVRISIMLIGLVYLYVSFRSGDAESRRKVLWFLEAVLAAAVLSLIAMGLRAVLGPSAPKELRIALGIGLNALATCHS